ncbi:MAG: hypothetical protein NVS1B7_5420 [Candidatus Saccharimonadales bacterium]
MPTPSMKIPLKHHDPLVTKDVLHIQPTWGPVVATVVTIAVYFISQYSGVLLVLLYPISQHWNEKMTNGWLQNSILAQFLSIFLIEIFVIILLHVFLQFKKSSFKVIGWNRFPHWEDVPLALAAFAAYFISLNFIVFPALKNLIHNLNFSQKQDIGFVNVHGPALILVFVSLAVLPPIVEETLFRGFLFTGLRKKLPLAIATLTTSFIFAIPHLQLGSGQAPLWVAGVDTFTLSLFLVYLRQKTHSLYASVLLHFLKNSLAFLALFIFRFG